MVFSVLRLLIDFVCLLTYWFLPFPWKIARCSVILLLPLFAPNIKEYESGQKINGLEMLHNIVLFFSFCFCFCFLFICFVFFCFFLVFRFCFCLWGGGVTFHFNCINDDTILTIKQDSNISF